MHWRPMLLLVVEIVAVKIVLSEKACCALGGQAAHEPLF